MGRLDQNQDTLWATCARLLFSVLGITILAVSASGQESVSPAGKMVDGPRFDGGLVVHLGSGDGTKTAALGALDNVLVHGLDSDPQNVVRAREEIRRHGLYGKVSVDRLCGTRLPYIDNLVNLVIAANLGDVPLDEVKRVLCPNGVAFSKRDDQWTKMIKPRPDAIDDWTHYLHDASNNAVAHDSVVGPPRHMQWVGSR